MKKSQLIQLIKECYEEILAEESTLTATARDREKQEKEQWLKAKKAATDAEINDLKTNNYSLEEMARIPTLYSLAPGQNPDDFTGAIKQIAQYLKDNPGKTKLEIAKGIGKNAQQAVNMVVKAMEEKGILDSQGLAAEPKYKKSDGLGTGLRGRKMTPEGARKRAIQSVYDKLKSGREDEITFEEDDLIGDEGMKKIRALVAAGGIKRGRKPKEDVPDGEEVVDNNVSTDDETEEDSEMYFQNDDDLDVPIDDEEIVDITNDEPESFENEPEFETNDELTNLINKKDELLGQLKRKEIDLSTYKELIGDIPQRIKALQSGEEEEINEEDFLKERMLKIANIKK